MTVRVRHTPSQLYLRRAAHTIMCTCLCWAPSLLLRRSLLLCPPARLPGPLPACLPAPVQEVEMGTGSVALDVVYQQLAKSKLEAGTQVISCGEGREGGYTTTYLSTG